MSWIAFWWNGIDKRASTFHLTSHDESEVRIKKGSYDSRLVLRNNVDNGEECGIEFGANTNALASQDFQKYFVSQLERSKIQVV